MKCLSTFLLGAASLAAGAPLQDPETITSPAASTQLDKRISEQSNCGLDMYQAVGERAVKYGIWSLEQKEGRSGGYGHDVEETIWGIPGKCTQMWCGGRVGFYLCMDDKDDNRPWPYNSKELATNVLDTFKDCYSRAPADSEKVSSRAFQYWGDGFNILVQGSADCKYRGKVVGDS